MCHTNLFKLSENVRLDDVTKPPIQTTVIDIASEFPIIASEHPVLQVRKIRRNSILVEQSQTVDFHLVRVAAIPFETAAD